MPRSLAILLTATDVAFLFYWCTATLSQFGVIQIPADWMYAHYDRPDVIAWNWSFLPLDLAFSFFGLRAVDAARRGEAWREFAIVSLTLTMAAGGMAVSYWAILREFDPLWFGTNLLLVIWPLPFMVSGNRTSSLFPVQDCHPVAERSDPPSADQRWGRAKK